MSSTSIRTSSRFTLGFSVLSFLVACGGEAEGDGAGGAGGTGGGATSATSATSGATTGSSVTTTTAQGTTVSSTSGGEGGGGLGGNGGGTGGEGAGGPVTGSGGGGGGGDVPGHCPDAVRCDDPSGYFCAERTGEDAEFEATCAESGGTYAEGPCGSQHVYGCVYDCVTPSDYSFLNVDQVACEEGGGTYVEDL